MTWRKQPTRPPCRASTSGASRSARFVWGSELEPRFARFERTIYVFAAARRPPAFEVCPGGHRASLAAQVTKHIKWLEQNCHVESSVTEHLRKVRNAESSRQKASGLRVSMTSLLVLQQAVNSKRCCTLQHKSPAVRPLRGAVATRAMVDHRCTEVFCFDCPTRCGT